MRGFTFFLEFKIKKTRDILPAQRIRDEEAVEQVLYREAALVTESVSVLIRDDSQKQNHEYQTNVLEIESEAAIPGCMALASHFPAS